MSTQMRTLVRWIKFNTVGAMGMAVQLAAVALLAATWWPRPSRWS